MDTKQSKVNWGLRSVWKKARKNQKSSGRRVTQPLRRFKKDSFSEPARKVQSWEKEKQVKPKGQRSKEAGGAEENMQNSYH